METTASVWIVHRDARVRAALTGLAAAGPEALAAAPTDLRLESASPPRAVVLGVAEDFEAELDFAHRFAPRLPDAAWILVADADDLEEARRLFDALPAELFTYPPDASVLRRRLREALARRSVASLSERRARDGLAARFARWFSDLELPELLRALDPRAATTSLLVCGEPGTGRSLLVRYIHAFGDRPLGAFASVRCTADWSTEALLDAIASAADRAKTQAPLTVCIEEVDRLPASTQEAVARWIEVGPPPTAVRAAVARWVATAGELETWAPEGHIEPELEQALAGIRIRIPRLRERPQAIEAVATEVAQAWARRRGESPRALGPDAVAALQEHRWPGNLRELEAVVTRSLAAGYEDPLGAEHLRFELPTRGLSSAALLAAALPVITPEEEARERIVPEAVPVQRPAPARAATEAASHLEPAALKAVRLVVRAVAHELAERVAAIRTLTERRPDAEFRLRFPEILGAETNRIDALSERLRRFASLPAPAAETVDVAELLEALLESRRERIEERRLLVLRELDREEPFALGEASGLRFALETLLDKILQLMPLRGDLYLATKHHPTGLAGEPCLRVLLRFQTIRGEPSPERESPAPLPERTPEIAVAEAVIREQGGTVAVDASEPHETLVLVDLRGPRQPVQGSHD